LLNKKSEVMLQHGAARFVSLVTLQPQLRVLRN
jgi:hypothetical protein